MSSSSDDEDVLPSSTPKTRLKIALKHGEDILQLPSVEKRKLYLCKDNYTIVNNIKTWPEYFKKNKKKINRLISKSNYSLPEKYKFNEQMLSKISLWEGDITSLEVDAIVNAANRTLMGGGGVDGAIHRAAGSALLSECRQLNGCQTGEAKLTYGYNLPAKYVIHTVGPMDGNGIHLEKCYNSCLKIFDEKLLKTIAFCCISTGIYGFSNKEAAKIALRCTRDWLEKKLNEGKLDEVERIIFCLFMEIDIKLYETFMPLYFPLEDDIKDKLNKSSSSCSNDIDHPIKDKLNKSSSSCSNNKEQDLEDDSNKKSSSLQSSPKDNDLTHSIDQDSKNVEDSVYEIPTTNSEDSIPLEINSEIPDGPTLND